MSIDIEQFHAVFFDESQEHLDEMEHLLMELDLNAPDEEQLNSIFRAAHSIKGGSGIFGFDALTDLTHVMENLLDKARKGTLQLTSQTVDLLLTTVDLLKTILDGYRENSPQPEEDIQAGVQALEAALNEHDSQSTATQAATEEVDDDDGFGFFDAPQTTSAQEDDDGWGLFEPAPETKAKSTEEEGFGFFDNAPATKVNTDAKPVQQSKGSTTTSQKSPSATKPKGETSSIRVDTQKIDAMVNLVGELVITQSMLSMISEEVTGSAAEKLQNAIAELQRNTREIQESAMSMRMLPVSATFNRFPRVVRDLSGKLGKQVELILEGGNTEIDKGMIEKLVDPLTHLVRNSIDHGIETVEARQSAGKDSKGTVTLRAQQRGSSIVISIIDDGAGLNRERILAKAAENGLPTLPDMPDHDVWQLIFEPGFSTAAEVTDVSGRGVGMDVVRRNIESIGGRIDIDSIAGKGSAFHIHLPLTLAIVDGICVSVGEQVFVIPLVNIIESIQPAKSQLKFIGNDILLSIREQYWPLVCVHELMGIDEANTDPTTGIVVLVESSKRRYGILVDALLGQQQVVIKSLEQHYKRVSGISGATIMGDGSVAMILDVDDIANQCRTESLQELAS